VGDNQGSSQCACIKQGATFKPCRICEADRSEIHEFNDIKDYRQSDYVHALQSESCKIFSKRLRKERLTNTEKSIRKIGELESLNPIPSTFLEPEARLFPEDKGTLMFPPDLLHTVCGGVLKSWIFWVMVIVVRCGELDPSYKDNVACLDACIGDYPCKQSMDGKVKAFPKGVSEFVKSATASGLSAKECSTSGKSIYGVEFGTYYKASVIAYFRAYFKA
jgi:hypothetical protein